MSDEALLELEARVLNTTESDICLDPSTEVCKMKSLLNYNVNKFRIRKKNPQTWQSRDEDVAKKVESKKLMLLMDEVRIFFFFSLFF